MLRPYEITTINGLDEEAIVERYQTITDEVASYLKMYLGKRYPSSHEELSSPLAQYEIELRVRVAVSQMLSELVGNFTSASEY